MKTLADRIFEMIPQTPHGLSMRSTVEKTRQDTAHVRAAFEALNASGRAQLVRRGTGRGGALYLVLPDQGVLACVICQKEFKNKKAKTCSYSCGMKMAWQSEKMRAKHKVSVKRAANRPERKAQLAALMKRINADPAERARRSEVNRKTWADPVKRAKRVVAIKEAWKGAAATERRAKATQRKNALWNDPEWRAQTVAAMRNGRRSRFKRAVLELASSVPLIPEEEIARAVGLPIRQVKILMYLANKSGELARKPVDGRNRKQGEEEIRHRVRLSKRTKALRVVKSRSCVICGKPFETCTGTASRPRTQCFECNPRFSKRYVREADRPGARP